MEQIKVIAYADGGSRGNPGPAGAGAFLEINGECVSQVSEYIGIATNNVAEYSGLVKILEKALELGYKNIEVRMDSELVVKQIKGEYRVKNEGLKPLFAKAKLLASKFDTFAISHVRREANKLADRLANDAMDKRQ
jgi:ribonuclease HI